MSVSWTDLSPQQQIVIVHLGLDLPNDESVGVEMRAILPELHGVVPSLCRYGLIAETRSAFEGVWLQLTSIRRDVCGQGRVY